VKTFSDGVLFGGAATQTNLNYVKEGSYSAAYLGMYASGSATIYYSAIGKIVTLTGYIGSASSTATGLLFLAGTNMPTEIRPKSDSGDVIFVIRALANGVWYATLLGIQPNDGTIYIAANLSGASFQSGQTFAIPTFSVTYLRV
jgi:hypothetical protein